MPPLVRPLAIALLLGLGACRSAPDDAPARPPGALHDHTPRHGGVVAMVGMIHLEALALPDGRVRLYLTDLYRQPLPLDAVAGAVTLRLRDQAPTLPLARGADALEAQGPPLAGEVIAAFALTRDGAPVEANFMLPVAASGGSAPTGAAGIPLDGCVAPPAGGGGRLPRCTLRFARPVAALAGNAARALLAVAVVDQGMSAWRLPGGTFAFGFAAPPAVALAVPEPPHPEAPNALVASPDGSEIAMALENRLIVYDAADGRLRRSFNGPGGIIRAAAWMPDGRALLVTSFYRAAAVLLAADDGRVLRQYAVPREGAGLAIAADGRLAIGDEQGGVSVFATDAERPAYAVAGGRGPARAVAFAGAQLLIGGDDGRLRAVAASNGAPHFDLPLPAAIHQLAVSPDGSRVAAAVGLAGDVALVSLADGRVVATLPGAGAQVLALAWTTATLAVGDVNGRVALWEPR
ncbi:MAG: WD40 repeat domain-containing protein [Deltaproteobacteria bacterium]|nr:WD40 repeat domain-containing protein [Deltaproteobacteria bacterium]